MKNSEFDFIKNLFSTEIKLEIALIIGYITIWFLGCKGIYLIKPPTQTELAISMTAYLIFCGIMFLSIAVCYGIYVSIKKIFKAKKKIKTLITLSVEGNDLNKIISALELIKK